MPLRRMNNALQDCFDFFFQLPRFQGSHPLLPVEHIHQIDRDGDRRSGPEEETARREDVFRVADADHGQGGFVAAGNLEGALVQVHVTAADMTGAFGKDKKYAAGFEEIRHGGHAADHQFAGRPRGRGRHVARLGDEPAEDRHTEKQAFDNGLLAGKLGDEKQRIQIGYVVADHDRPF